MGLERIEKAFQAPHRAFMPYTALGYPTPEQSLKVLQTLVDCGADLLELGVPFSDPLADGPVIQAATQRALENGMNLPRCIEMAAKLRAGGAQPALMLMSYVNPILAYGVERCAADCASAGIDGFIVPDLPPEEADELHNACQRHNLGLAYLLAPTSTPERIELVAQKARGFIYLVSLTGVTGARTALPENLNQFVQRVRSATHTPLAVGFGIGSGEQAEAVARVADGVIVGSALVRCAAESMESVQKLATEMRTAINRVEKGS